MSSKKITPIVDEVLSVSSLQPAYISILRDSLIKHYEAKTLLVTDDYPQVAQALYEKNDGLFYSIISLCSEDEYSFFLIQADQVPPREAIKDAVYQVKASFTGTNIELGILIQGIHKVKSDLDELLHNCTRSTRKSIGYEEIVVELPPMSDMKRYYECERKVQYNSKEHALSDLRTDNQVYLCVHCAFWHQGKEPTGMTVPQNIMEGRYRTAWRRYHNI